MTDLERIIKDHEERIHTANMHPRNGFFIGVKKDSEKKLKILYNLRPHPHPASHY